MGANTKIEWASHTFNHARGCAKVSAGCKGCYAEALSRRNPAVLGKWGPNGTRVVASESKWREPLAWDRAAARAGERPRVFCASLADVFEDWPGIMLDAGDCQLWHVAEDRWIASAQHAGFGGPRLDPPYRKRPNDLVRPLTMDDVRARVFALIDATPYLDWLLVTKRPENVRRMWPGGRRENVWLLTSVEDQENAEARIPELLKCRDLAAVLGLSMEPLLGPVDLRSIRLRDDPLDCDDNPAILNAFNDLVHHPETVRYGPIVEGSEDGIDWVIVGGESGPHARPMHPGLGPIDPRRVCQRQGWRSTSSSGASGFRPRTCTPKSGCRSRISRCSTAMAR